MEVSIELILNTTKSFNSESDFFEWYQSLNWQSFIEDNKTTLKDKFLFETVE